MRRRTCSAFAVLIAVATFPAYAGTDPWMAAGDLGLRHDIQLLTDSGAFRLPTTGWPIPTADVLRAIGSIGDRGRLSASESAALARIERKIAAQTSDDWNSSARLSVAAKPTLLRTFADTPREEGELGASFAKAGEHFSARLQLTAAVDPDDNQQVRLDGSHVTAQWGNWLFSAGAMDRWWGPGWDGSLLLSNNARPVPSLTLDRASSQPFETRWLSWLGPWRLTTFMGALEQNRRDIDNALLFGMRIAIHPTAGLEIAVERTAQWCGDGRPCGGQAFWNLFTGHDNQGENVSAQDEPGNQLASWVIRWASPIGNWPYALYLQKTGETIDHQTLQPFRNMYLMGAEYWGSRESGLSWRVHLEFAGTSCGELDSTPGPLFDCAYNNGIFNFEGYRYRGRPIGHSADGDARVYSLGLLVTRPDAVTGTATLRFAELNRGGSVPDVRQAVSAFPVDLWNLELALQIPRGGSELRFGTGFDYAQDDLTGRNESAVRAFAEWRQRF